MLQNLRDLKPAQTTSPVDSTIDDLMELQKQMQKILTSRDQIYFATRHWGGTIATTDGKAPEENTLEDYQELIISMVDVMWSMQPILLTTQLRLRTFMARWGHRWPKGPRDSPGVFTFFQTWRPEETVPDVEDIESMLNYWVQKRGNISPSCTEVIRSFKKYEPALKDMLKRPPEAQPGRDIGTCLIWRQHILAACCKYPSEH